MLGSGLAAVTPGVLSFRNLVFQCWFALGVLSSQCRFVSSQVVACPSGPIAGRDCSAAVGGGRCFRVPAVLIAAYVTLDRHDFSVRPFGHRVDDQVRAFTDDVCQAS